MYDYWVCSLISTHVHNGVNVYLGSGFICLWLRSEVCPNGVLKGQGNMFMYPKFIGLSDTEVSGFLVASRHRR
jgi:hypothetical protein